MIEYQIQGLKEFEAAIARNPTFFAIRGGVFIVRALAEYRNVIWRKPWRVGMSGGGVPVATGNLRDTHNQAVQYLMGRIYPTASYAHYVHRGRPWLSYAFEQADSKVQEHEKDLADAIIEELSR